MFAFLSNLMRDEDDTRDVLQEVFIKLARQPELLRGVRDERAFLLRLAHNAAIDLMRRRSARDSGAAATCFWLLMQVVVRAFSRALANTGNRMAARIAMIAITTSSSMSVNAQLFLRICFILLFVVDLVC